MPHAGTGREGLERLLDWLHQLFNGRGQGLHPVGRVRYVRYGPGMLREFFALTSTTGSVFST